MTDLEFRTDAAPPKGPSRRTVIKAAAWSVPVIAATAALPGAAASVDNASLAWTASNTGLLALNVLDSATVITAQALVTVPTVLTLDNGLGAISGESASVQITVGTPGGINLSLGRARGFGVYSFQGAVTPSASRTATYAGAFGFPTTSYTTTISVNVASDGTLDLPVVFGLAGEHTGIVSLNALATFPVTATVTIGGRTLTAPSTISVPIGAGIL